MNVMETARKKYGPKKSPAREIVTLIPAVSSLAVLCWMFPFSAVRFSARDPLWTESATSCAFVVLDPETETRAMEDVRSALSVDSRIVMEMSADLSVSTIPDEECQPVTDVADRLPLPAPPRLDFAVVPSVPSLASPEPLQIEQDEDGDAHGAFSRRELLEYDRKE